MNKLCNKYNIGDIVFIPDYNEYTDCVEGLCTGDPHFTANLVMGVKITRIIIDSEGIRYYVQKEGEVTGDFRAEKEFYKTMIEARWQVLNALKTRVEALALGFTNERDELQTYGKMS